MRARFPGDVSVGSDQQRGGEESEFVVDADELRVKVGQKNVAMSDLGPEIDAFVVVILEGIDAARLRDGEGFSRSGGWIVNEFSYAD